MTANTGGAQGSTFADAERAQLRDGVRLSALALSARQLVTLYARRMQIELSFRALKSHRYGQGLEDSLTRRGPRIGAVADQRAGGLCQLGGRPGLRGERTRPVAVADPIPLPAVFGASGRT